MFQSIFKFIAFPVLFVGLSSAAKAEEDLQLSGFARLISGYLDTSDASFKGYDNNLSFSPDSLLGVQGTYAPHQKFSITTQVVGYADDDEDSGIEWLYGTYRPVENIQIKAGKLRTPFFSLSDVTDVGYAYPWINPPQQVYNAYLFKTFEGLDIIYSYSGDSFEASVEAYAGRFDGELEIFRQLTDFEVSSMRGIIGKLNYKNFEGRIAYYAGSIDFDLPQLDLLADILEDNGFNQSASKLNLEGDGDVSQVGIAYDNLNYFVRAEWVNIHTDLELASKSQSYYLTLGYYFPTLTTHLTFAESDNEAPFQPREIPLGVSPLFDQLAAGYDQVFDTLSADNLESWTLGLRWDFRHNMAFKAEYSRLLGRPGEDAFFRIDNDEEFDRKANLYQIGLEWVF